MTRALITMPARAKRGEVIEIRALIAHPMETGFRTDIDGQRVPRSLIRRFACRYNGELVVSAELFPAIAANPYLAFFATAAETGTLAFTWEGDDGFAQTETRALTVA
jgi:sulfur-oxidizing protein SoxZ